MKISIMYIQGYIRAKRKAGKFREIQSVMTRRFDHIIRKNDYEEKCIV